MWYEKIGDFIFRPYHPALVSHYHNKSSLEFGLRPVLDENLTAHGTWQSSSFERVHIAPGWSQFLSSFIIQMNTHVNVQH